MSEPSVGLFSFSGVGNETTWGTAVARTAFFEHSGATIDAKWDDIAYPGFRGRSPRAHGRGLNRPDLEVRMPGNYTGMELLFYHLFGKVAVSTPGGGTLAREQLYTLDDSVAPLKGLTGEILYSHGDAAVKAYSISGLKVVGATIELNEDRTVDFAFRFSGYQVQPLGAASTATYPTRLPMWWNHAHLKKATAEFDFRSATIEIDCGYEVDRRKMGSYFRKEPTRARPRSVVVTFASDFEDPTLWHDLLQGTGSTPTETASRFQVDVLHPDADSIESGQAYEWNLDLPACYVRSSQNPITEPGITPSNVVLFAEYDTSGGAEMMKLTTRNKVTAVP